MEYVSKNKKCIVNNQVFPLTGNVRLTGGRLKTAFDNNISFLKKFDIDRIMYWFRVASGKPAPNAPYAYADGHFENNLFGQTAGMYLMGAGTALLWQEDVDLRNKMNSIVNELAEFMPEDGCLLPVRKSERFTLEYPNYVRAWLIFGLLAAGYAGNNKAFEIARKFGDWFNNSKELSMVKDMNLGFQGILANTELYLSPAGKEADLDVAQKYYREDWWLKQLENKDHAAICRHPNHPHGTILTALEGYLDIYRITGEEKLLECAKNCLSMIEDKWQHVGGGIVMCEAAGDPQYPGCNFISQSHLYNELCCSTFWILLNQRMALLEPNNAHYYDQIEDSIYNMLVAAQVDNRGYHYNGFLEGSKDYRFADITTCCAATGARLASMLPQFLYTYNTEAIYINMYTDSIVNIDGSQIEVSTDMPYGGKVNINVKKWNHKKLKLRVPHWCASSITVLGVEATPGEYLSLDNITSGLSISLEFVFTVRTTLYSGADIVSPKQRYAFQYGPLLLAMLRSKNAYMVCDISNIDIEQTEKKNFIINGNNQTEFMPYMDIKDEPFNVYPIVDIK